MKKNIFIFLVIISFAFFSTKVLALNLGGEIVDKAAKEAGFADANETTLSTNIGIVVNMILSVVGVLFTILMVYAGYTWMVARGDEGKVDKAKDIIKASIIGLIITLAAYSITNFIVPRVLERTLSMINILFV